MAVKSGWIFYVLMNNEYRRFFYYHLCYKISINIRQKVVVEVNSNCRILMAIHVIFILYKKFYIEINIDWHLLSNDFVIRVEKNITIYII